MFLWTTTTIINSLKDSSGKDLVKVWTDAEDVEEGKAGFSGAYPVLKVKRDKTFEARYVSKIYKAVAYNASLCEMQVNCTKLLALVKEDMKPAHCRLAFYVALEGSEESIYANDFYQKGKPFSVGFEISKSDSAETVAKKIKKNAEKYGVVMYGKKIFDLSVEGAVLTVKGTHEYQRFKNAMIAIDDVIEEDVVAYYQDGVGNEVGEVFTLVNRGVNGFGTYHQLVKDLRLPTVHHNKWLQLHEDEKPVVGAKYNQYIITYCAPSMANPGFTVIGQHNMSVTTHVFWVNLNIDTEFQEALTAAGLVPEAVNTVAKDDKPSLKLKAEGGKDFAANHEQKVVHKEAAAADKVVKA